MMPRLRAASGSGDSFIGAKDEDPEIELPA